MHWPDPAPQQRIVEIRDNLIARIAEAESEGWLGEVEGLRISLAGPTANSPRSTSTPTPREPSTSEYPLSQGIPERSHGSTHPLIKFRESASGSCSLIDPTSQITEIVPEPRFACR
jgi:hypothetical protein